ncbi:unnamed protein product [Calypogeia fissa]
MQMPQWVTMIRQQVDSWAQQQRAALPAVNPVGWPPWHWKLKLPWHEDKKKKEELQAEYRRRKMQIEDLCAAVKVEDLEDLQDVLGAMVLAECAYKRPDAEVLRAMNSYKAEFGGRIVSLHKLQTSLDHVPHRYMLAEGGDTLFAAFAGTKYYRDFVADANFLQGALFHDDEADEDVTEEEAETAAGVGNELSTVSNAKPKLNALKPAAHRGFLGRAKGIPAVELYRLAQKRDRKLVLCGHSLGGAVAVLATLAILRVFATPSVAKSGGRLQIKCITFSQPPVGNAALRDYVHQKGWQHHFRTYCIPEDVIPRILSPAYFQHYRTQASELLSQAAKVVPAISPDANKEQESGSGGTAPSAQSSSYAESNRMVLGVGPLPKYIWRLPRLVPLIGTPRPFQWFKNRNVDDVSSRNEDTKVETPAEITPLEIEEEAGSVSLTTAGPISDIIRASGESGDPSSVTKEGEKSETVGGTNEVVTPAPEGNKEGKGGNGADWLKRVPSVSVPSLPSYVPFGQLYLLERSSLVPLSASEYTQLTSVQSVIQEVKERFRSHTMRSYRARFLRIYDANMTDNSASPLKVEHLPHLPHLQTWLGILGARIAESGIIAEPIVLRTATALVPLGWTGVPGDKGAKPLIVDVHGFGLHLCTLVRAHVNGHWCSTTMESLPPPAFPQQELQLVQPKLQKMRIRVGPPIENKNAQKKTNPEKRSEDVVSQGIPVANSLGNAPVNLEVPNVGSIDLGVYEDGGLGEVTIQCSTDFMTASQNVVSRLRRVRLLGLEGAGKTSLYFALLGAAGRTVSTSDGGVLPDMDLREGVANGINYVDAAGVNLQDLVNETERLREEVRLSTRRSGKKLDLVILVHNLAHKIPRLHRGDSKHPRPALGMLLDEVATAGIPVVLAITNKFAVSADRRHLAALTIMNTYQVPPSLTVVVNSLPYSVHGLSNESFDKVVPAIEASSKGPAGNGLVQGAAQRLFFGPMKLVPRPFGKREVVLPTEGISKLTSLIQTVLSDKEESTFEDLAKEHLALQSAEELVESARKSATKSGAATAAAVGAAFGAGFGVIVAVVVGAANALRKP